MSHDPLFEQYIADALKARGAKPEHKKMFGGIAFMVNGNMSVGITNKGDFMVRFDGARHEEILQWPGAKPMTFGHKNMKGFLFVDAEAVSTKTALDKWVKLSLAHVNSLPKKRAKATVGKTAARKVAPKKKATRNPKR